MQATQATETCPNCQAAMPVHKGYVTWCDQCEWHVENEEAQPHRKAQGKLSQLFDDWYEKLGKRHSRALLDEVKEMETIRPAMTGALALALLISVVTQAVTVALVAAGAYFLITGWSELYGVFWGGIALILAWMVRPVINRLPKQHTLLSRSEFPALYRLVDELSERLGAARIEGILLDDDYNAFYGRFGWRHRPYMGLGLPLLTAVRAQELVALISHELAHGVNGDPNRSWLLGNTIQTLVHWYWVLRPDSIIPAQNAGIMQYVLIPLTGALWLLSELLKWLIFLLIQLSHRESQRAEYLADAIAATMSGTEAKRQMLDKLHLAWVYSYTVRQHLLNRKQESLFDAFKIQLGLVPERERERVRREYLRHGTRLDATHPPTAYRMEFIQSRGSQLPQYLLTPQHQAEIDRELAVLQVKMQPNILDRFRDRFFA